MNRYKLKNGNRPGSYVGLREKKHPVTGMTLVEMIDVVFGKDGIGDVSDDVDMSNWVKECVMERIDEKIIEVPIEAEPATGDGAEGVTTEDNDGGEDSTVDTVETVKEAPVVEPEAATEEDKVEAPEESPEEETVVVVEDGPVEEKAGENVKVEAEKSEPKKSKKRGRRKAKKAE